MHFFQAFKQYNDGNMKICFVHFLWHLLFCQHPTISKYIRHLQILDTNIKLTQHLLVWQAKSSSWINWFWLDIFLFNKSCLSLSLILLFVCLAYSADYAAGAYFDFWCCSAGSKQHYLELCFAETNASCGVRFVLSMKTLLIPPYTNF